MEKFIFLATIKSKLTEMNLPQKTVEKHVKIFEDCFKGKGASDIDKVIDSAGGIDGILLSIYNLENAKQKDNQYIPPKTTNGNASTSPVINEIIESGNVPAALPEEKARTSGSVNVNEATSEQADPAQTIVIDPVTSTEKNAENTDSEAVRADDLTDVEPDSDTPSTATESVKTDTPENIATKTEESEAHEVDLNGIFTADTAENKQNGEETDSPTIEIPKTPEIVEHIKEAEKITETLERIPIPQNNNSEDFPSELSDYDFEKLFEEKLSKPETWVKKLREKMSQKTFKWTLPLAFLATAVLFIFVTALFPLLFATAIICAVTYVAALILGLCFSVIPLGYGIYMCFKSMPIALYELGIAAISTGTTMLASILLYNYVKRLVPFLLKQLVKLFKLAVKVTKRYFKSPAKEVE